MSYDVLVGPAAPTTAPRIGESLSDPLKMYLGDIYTVLINIIGLPAATIPCGFDNTGLPIGLQIIGPHLSEERILQVAYAFEQSHDYHKQMALIREVD